MGIEIPIVHSPAAFGVMREATALLTDRKALWRQFDADGYLLFRGVLDLEPVRRLRSEYTAELTKQGMIREGDEDLLFTNTDLSNVRKAGGALLPADAMHERQPWREFTAHAAITGFIRDLVEDDPIWVPIVEYKAVPPAPRGETRFNFVHQDSFYNKGVNFLTCWVPLSDIDIESGGIAVAQGMHKQSIHDQSPPPTYFARDGAIPDDVWVRSEYKPGDLLLMHRSLPHSGLSNHSDRFRLSMDVRFVPRSENPPMVGKVVTATPNRIVLRGDDGSAGDYAITNDTNFRDYGVGLVDRSNITNLYLPGDELIVANENGYATSIRRTSAGQYVREMSGH